MSRRRKLKSAQVTLPKVTKIYDLRPADKQKEDYVDVECPLNGDTIRVPAATKDDPLVWAYSRGIIDEPQRDVGEIWRKIRQTSQFGLAAIDTTRDVVDGGKIYDPISDNQIRATQWLSMIDRELADLGRKINEPMNRIMYAFLGERKFPKEIAGLFGRYGDRATTHYMGRCRDGLETMAVAHVSFSFRS